MKHLSDLFYESLEFVNSHPDLTSNNIPDHLFDFWLCRDRITLNPTIEQLFSYTIFNHSYKTYAGALKYSKIKEDEGLLDFRLFQQILATEFVCRKIKARFKPKKLFDFSSYGETLDIYLNERQLKLFNEYKKTILPLRGESYYD